MLLLFGRLTFLEKNEREPSNFLRTLNIVVFHRILFFIKVNFINSNLFEITLSAGEGKCTESMSKLSLKFVKV